MTEQLIFEQKIDLPYNYTRGGAARVPPRAARAEAPASTRRRRVATSRRAPFAPDGRRLTGSRRSATRACSTAWTTVHHARRRRRPRPDPHRRRELAAAAPARRRRRAARPRGARARGLARGAERRDHRHRALRAGAMSVRGLAHVGAVVADLGPVAELFGERLGSRSAGPRRSRSWGWPSSGSRPARPRSSSSPRRGRLARGQGARARRGRHPPRRPGGRRLDELLAQLDGAGVPIRDREPRRGAHGSRVSFLDPSAASGALVELVEPRGA